MSVALPFAGVGELVASPTESAAFGFEVARLSIGGGWASDVPSAEELAIRVSHALEAEKADTVIVRFPSELVQVARLDRPGGRRLQHAGTLLYWEDPQQDDAPIAEGIDVIVFRGGEQVPTGFVDSAAAVIADSFDGYLNHYSYNSRIPAATARDGYADWARRTTSDPAGAAILLREGGAGIAVATLRFHADGDSVVGEVELASVASGQQGSGRYGLLWSAIRTAAREGGAARLIISTQASNLRVQRAWARLGLVPLASFDTVHATRDGS